MNQPGESSISVGGIADRAEKLEVAQKAEEAKAGAPDPTAEEKAAADAAAAAKVTPAPEAKKETVMSDPELRKWATKTSMENAEIKKQLQTLADLMTKTSKKPVDWKTLAKDPEKLEKAIEEYHKQGVEEVTKKAGETTVQWTARYTKAENQRRHHDPAYPRWAELQPFIMKYAASADRRIDFEKDPNDVMDFMYELAQKDAAADPAYKAPATKVVNPDAKYTDADLAAKVKEAVDKAVAEAQKGLKAEENGAGVGGMGKGATKGGAGDSVKKAAHAMPLGALKNAIQEATERLQNS